MKIIFLFISVFLISCTQFKTRQFELSYEVNINESPKSKVEVWIPLPQSNLVQTISNLTIKTDLEFIIKTDNVYKNSYIYILDEDGFETDEIIHIDCNVLRKEQGTINDPTSNLDAFQKSNSHVPVGDIFSEIIQEYSLTKNDMRGVYDFILQGMHYGKPKSYDDTYYQSPWLFADSTYGRKKVKRDSIVLLYQQAKIENGNYTFGMGNSLYACDIGVGNCTDYHSYFMSLGRTLGVPVRFHMGFPILNQDSADIKGYHCWADYFVEGVGWNPVDISEADKHPEMKDYYFGNICENRVELSIGSDIILEGYEKKSVNFLIYPMVEIDDVDTKSFTTKISYKNL